MRPSSLGSNRWPNYDLARAGTQCKHAKRNTVFGCQAAVGGDSGRTNQGNDDGHDRRKTAVGSCLIALLLCVMWLSGSQFDLSTQQKPHQHTDITKIIDNQKPTTMSSATSPTPEQRARLCQRRQHNDPTTIHPMRVMIGRTTLQLEGEVRLRCALQQPALRNGAFFFHTSRKQVAATHRHLITMHNVKVTVIEADLHDSHRLLEIQDGMQVLIKAFENDPRPKVINDVYQPWLLDMLVSSSIDVMDYINIERMDTISSEASRWLVDHAKTVQLMRCTFEDSGLAFCRRLNEPSCVVDTIKFLETSVVGSALSIAVASSTTLVSLNIKDRRHFIGDGFWTSTVNGIVESPTIKSVFLCGSYRDSSTLKNDICRLLQSPQDRKFSLFLSPYAAPSNESQSELCQAILDALRESRHLVDLNHLFPVINVNDWNNKIKPLIERNKVIRSLRNAMESVHHGAPPDVTMISTLLDHSESPSPDDVFRFLRTTFAPYE